MKDSTADFLVVETAL